MSLCRFHRNQPVFVESKDLGKVSGVITAVGTQEVSYTPYKATNKGETFTKFCKCVNRIIINETH